MEKQDRAVMKKSTDNGKTETGSTVKKTRMDRVVDTISGIFVPTLPVITAAGILKALMLLLSALNLLNAESNTYYVLSFVSSAGFYFLPLLLAHSTAKRFGGDPYLALFLTAILLHPDFISVFKEGGSLTFLSLPITMMSYSSTVVPAIVIGWSVAFVEKLLRRWVPGIIAFFAVPLLTTLLMAPLILIVLGPAGMFIGDGLSNGLNFIHEKIGWPAVALLAAMTPFLVTAGFGLCFLPLALSSITATGFDPFSRPAFLAANVAMASAALAVFVKSKVRENKSLSLQTSIVAYMGVTEPSIYGVLLPLKRPYIASIIGAAAGGAFAGITDVKSVAYASPCLITLPIFLSGTFVYALLTVAVTFVTTFVLTWLIGFDDKPLHSSVTI